MENNFSSVINAADPGETMWPFNGFNGTNLSTITAPRRDSLYIVIPMTIIYALIFITGVVGNIVTFIVIVKNKHMHTATNYYLFSLAISDLLLLVSGLPQEIVSIWCRYPYLFGELFCVLRGLSAETSTNASILTITAFTIERYVAICHPFLSQTMSKLSRVIKLILLIWLVALSFAVPQAIQFGVITIDNDPDQAMCTLKRTIIDHSFVLSSFLFFVTPMTLITVLYILIGIKLRKSTLIKRNRGSLNKNYENTSIQKRGSFPIQHQSSKRVVKMLVAVVIAFFICWAPFHAQRLVYTYGSNKDSKPKGAVMKLIYEIITYISGILYYVSTTINPILYHIMSLKFREAFQDTIARCTCVLSSEKRRTSYFVFNGLYQPGTLSRRESRSYETQFTSTFMREDSVPTDSMRYKYRRKTMSISEATDDSVQTEITQISQKYCSPYHSEGKKKFTMVVQLKNSNFQPKIRRKRFWKNNSRRNLDKFWNAFNFIRSESPVSQTTSEYFMKPGNSRRKQAGIIRKESINSSQNLKMTGNMVLKNNHNANKELNSSISNSYLKDCVINDLLGDDDVKPRRIEIELDERK